MMCLLGVAKVKLYTPFCSKNRHFGALFRQDRFPLENAFNIGHVLYKRPIIVIVAPLKLRPYGAIQICLLYYYKSCIVNRHIGVGDSKNVIVFDPLLTGHVNWRMRRHRIRL